MRARVAPRAERMANSFEREAAQARRRFERLTQAMSRMPPTADQSTTSERCSLPLTWSLRRTGTARYWPQESGYLLLLHKRGAMAAASSRACASETPDLRRPIKVKLLP